MSYGEGGKGLTVCIFAVVSLGLLFVGTLLCWNPFPPTNGTTTTTTTGISGYTDYNFTSYESEFIDSVALNFYVNSGSISVELASNPSLLYKITISTKNETVLENGPPEVQQYDGIILLSYQDCDITVTLGSGIT